MIIHITGESGAGKTTLGNKLQKFKNVLVVDTDTYNDENFLFLMKNNKKFKDIIKKGGKKHWVFLNKMVKVLDLKAVNTYIKQASQNNKILIFVGFDHNNVLPTTKIDKKYRIKIDPKILYKQNQLRTIDDICYHANDIKKLIKNTTPTDAIFNTILYKYKVRGAIRPYGELADRLKEQNAKETKKGYKLYTSFKIYNDIKKIVSTYF